jgi:hypothetical protein
MKLVRRPDFKRRMACIERARYRMVISREYRWMKIRRWQRAYNRLLSQGVAKMAVRA